MLATGSFELLVPMMLGTQEGSHD